MNKLVSINIPFYNSLRNELQDCITTIKMFTHHPYELVLVDDGSDDGESSEFAKEYADVYIRHNETEGIAKSRHDGILASSGDYICVVDSDTVFTPFWLSRLVNKYSASQDNNFKVYILGAVVSCWLGVYLVHPRYNKEKGLLDVGEIGGACMLFDKSLVDLIGNFDPELYNLLSDLDFCRRVHQIQIPGVIPKVCVAPEVVVYHHGWVDPETDVWVITEENMSTRAQGKFYSREWMLKKLHGLEILYERWGIQKEHRDRLRAELGTKNG